MANLVVTERLYFTDGTHDSSVKQSFGEERSIVIVVPFPQGHHGQLYVDFDRNGPILGEAKVSFELAGEECVALRSVVGPTRRGTELWLKESLRLERKSSLRSQIVGESLFKIAPHSMGSEKIMSNSFFASFVV